MSLFGLPSSFEGSRPHVTLKVMGPNRLWYPVNFVADAGNDVTLMNEQTARMLGINHNCSGNSSFKVAGIHGPPSSYCMHNVNMAIGRNMFPLTVGVGPVRENLLGRHGIFDRFRVIYEANKVTFQSMGYQGRCCGIF